MKTSKKYLPLILIIFTLLYLTPVKAEESSYSLIEFAKSLNLDGNSFRSDPSGIIDTDLGKLKLNFPDGNFKYREQIKSIVIDSLKQIRSFLALNKISDFNEFEQLEWNIIFRGFKEEENNKFNSKYFHYALVGPPADVVLDISKFISDNGELNSKELKKTLVHEFSHVVEYVLLGKSFSRRERWHGEGFAVWLTTKVLNEDSGVKHYFINSRWKTIYFSASPEDYYYSYLIYKNIEDKYGMNKIFELYNLSEIYPKSFKEILYFNLNARPEDMLLTSYYRNN